MGADPLAGSEYVIGVVPSVMTIFRAVEELDDNPATYTVQGPTTGIARKPVAVEPFLGSCQRAVKLVLAPARVPVLADAPDGVDADKHPRDLTPL